MPTGPSVVLLTRGAAVILRSFAGLCPWHASCTLDGEMAPVPAPVTWLALLAATTLGAGELDHVRAWVSGGLSGEVSYRLVVQTYAPESVDAAGRVAPRARPLGSMQRAVTAEELSRGVSVSVVQVRVTGDPPVVVAWVEPGEPTLELDALTARPAPEALVGVSRSAAGERARIVVS